MIDALISGRLFGTPVSRTSRNGNPFVTAKLRAAAGEESVFVNVITFSRTTCEALLALQDGDSVALSGELKVSLYQGKDGTWKPSLDLTAHQVLTAYHVRRKRQAVAEAGEKPAASPAASRPSARPFDDSLEGIA